MGLMEFLSKHQQGFMGVDKLILKFTQRITDPPSIINLGGEEPSGRDHCSITVRYRCRSNEARDCGVCGGRDTDQQNRAEDPEASPQECGPPTLDRGAQTIWWRKNVHRQKLNLAYHFTPHTKINSKCTREFN